MHSRFTETRRLVAICVLFTIHSLQIQAMAPPSELTQNFSSQESLEQTFLKWEALSPIEKLRRFHEKPEAHRDAQTGGIVPTSYGLQGGMNPGTAVPPSPGGQDRPWYFDPELIDEDGWVDKGPFRLREAGAKDKAFVQAMYNQYPVPGHEIHKVLVIRDQAQLRNFEGGLVKLNAKEGKPVFDPKWGNENQPGHRQEVMNRLGTMVTQSTKAPHVKLMPVWHGTNAVAAQGILESGFANLALVDAGFFGKGLYGTNSAEYSHRVYGKALLLSWMAFTSAYPVIRGDMNKLTAKGVYQRYDAHYVPVVPRTPSPHEVNYLPTRPGQEPKFDEIVVFQRDQMMPRYVVELRPTGSAAPTGDSLIEQLLTATVAPNPAMDLLEVEPEPLGAPLEDPIGSLRSRSQADKDADPTVVQGLSLYVPAQGADQLKSSYQPEEMYPLKEKVDAFLQDARLQTLLLQGDSGAGKSLFGHYLERELWNHYSDGDPIPLFISLPRIQKPNKDVVQQFLQMRGFNAEQINAFKQDKRFVFILDGYDEIKTKVNLIQNHRFNEAGSWQGKVIVSSRSQYLSDADDRLFWPEGATALMATQIFQKVFIPAFSQEQLHSYIEQFAASDYNIAHLSAEQLKERLQAIPNIEDMIQTPFALNLILSVLHVLDSTGNDKFSRWNLYEVFVSQWFEQQKERIMRFHSNSIPQGWSEVKIKEVYGEYSEDLAWTMFLEDTQVIQRGDGTVANASKFDQFFDDSKSEIQYGLKGSPLRRVGQRDYSFIHKSFQEYFAVQGIINELKYGLDKKGRNVAIQDRLTTSYKLNQKLLNAEPAILDFMVDAMKDDENLKKKLWEVLLLSKQREEMSVAAANAITILNRARESFSRKDLSKVKIRGANLDHGNFHGTNLKEADLRDVSFFQAQLAEANLEWSQMDGVSFGEQAHFNVSNALVDFSPNGELMARRYALDPKVYLWDVRMGKRIGVFNIQGGVGSVTYSPDGAMLARGSSDGTVHQWDVRSGEPRGVFKGHTGIVKSVTYSPDGAFLAAGSSDGTVRQWDVISGDPRRVLRGHTGSVENMTYSPDGAFLAAGSSDGTVRQWDVISGDPRRVLRGHTGSVENMTYSPDGAFLAAGSSDGTVRQWDVRSGELRGVFNIQGGVGSVTYSPDGAILATGSHDGTVRLWDVRSGEPRGVFKGHTGSVESVRYSPDGAILTTRSSDGTVRQWDVRTGDSRAELNGHTGSVKSVTYSPDGAILATGSSDGTVRQWDVISGEPRGVFKGHTGSVESVRYSPDGAMLATGSHDGTVRLWDVKSGELRGVLRRGPTSPITSVTYSPDGAILATRSSDNTVRLWNVISGELIGVLKGQVGSVGSVTYGPQGAILATGDNDGTVRLWDVRSGELKGELKANSKMILSVTYSPDGATLATRSIGAVRLWDIRTGKQRAVLKGPVGIVRSVTYSPDGAMLATGSHDGTVRLWDMSSGELRGVLEGHTSPITSLTYSPDGASLAIGSDDHAVRRWDLDTESLVWIGGTAALNFNQTRAMNIKDLSGKNWRLMKQGGALLKKKKDDCIISSLSILEDRVQKSFPSSFLGTRLNPEAANSQIDLVQDQTLRLAEALDKAVHVLKIHHLAFGLIEENIDQALQSVQFYSQNHRRNLAEFEGDDHGAKKITLDERVFQNETVLLVELLRELVHTIVPSNTEDQGTLELHSYLFVMAILLQSGLTEQGILSAYDNLQGFYKELHLEDLGLKKNYGDFIRVLMQSLRSSLILEEDLPAFDQMSNLMEDTPVSLPDGRIVQSEAFLRSYVKTALAA